MTERIAEMRHAFLTTAVGQKVAGKVLERK